VIAAISFLLMVAGSLLYIISDFSQYVRPSWMIVTIIGSICLGIGGWIAVVVILCLRHLP